MYGAPMLGEPPALLLMRAWHLFVEMDIALLLATRLVVGAPPLLGGKATHDGPDDHLVAYA